MTKWLILFSGFLISYSYGQSLAQEVKTDHSRREAVIFGSDYKDILIVPKEYDRFTPDITQINSVERVLCKSIQGFRNNFRQYVGYINTESDSIILVSILSKKVIKKNQESWKREFIYGLGDFYERNQRIIYYNLSENKILKL
ncbi:hypothetical protein [Fulvivirga imtechensis]|uniref:hypothetical protein n=1 Tax=Fulvivirga imtechensis TaxID=881893 RepID=UPI00058C0372|nr:hypothetical protein [Fulvivirga imtechensis]